CGHFIFFTFSTLICPAPARRWDVHTITFFKISGLMPFEVSINMTWKAAKEYCRKHHTDLATVSNQTDMHRLHNPAKFQAGAWIGLQREWRWSQPGVEFNESKWSQGEPNNLNNQENCWSPTARRLQDTAPESCKLSLEHFLDRPVQRL
uniref:C-type lectin domain-containing protein n=1 Tax=Sander lucioperca TaxID=283035 RepID=A0A8C9XE96_SANLU